MKISHKKRQREYKIRYPWIYTFGHIKQRCNNPKCKDYPRYGGRGIKCYLTREDMEALWDRDKGHLIKKPTIDREDNDGNYTLSNCRFIETGLNSSKDKYIKIKQYDLKGNYIKTWDSQKEISENLGICQTNISHVINGRHKIAGGYKWLKE